MFYGSAANGNEMKFERNRLFDMLI